MLGLCSKVFLGWQRQFCRVVSLNPSSYFHLPCCGLVNDNVFFLFFFLVCPEQLMKPVSFQTVPWENAIGFIGLWINSAQDKVNLQAEIECQVSLIVLCKSLTR